MQTSRFVPVPYGGAYLSDLASILGQTPPGERLAMLRCPALVELPPGTFGPGVPPLAFDAPEALQREARAERLALLTARLRPEDVKAYFLSPRAPETPVLVGSGPRVDLPLPREDGIAARHAQLFERRGLWRVVDNEAGTFIEGKRLPAGIPMPIVFAQRVRFGERELALFAPEDLLALAIPPAPEPQPARFPPRGCDLAALTPVVAGVGRDAFVTAHRRPFLLQVPHASTDDVDDDDGGGTRAISAAALRESVRQRGASDVRVHALGSRRHDASVIVGRDGEDCDVALGDRSVSRRHAVLRWRERALTVVDLESRNGTWLGREQLLPGVAMPVAPGHTLSFGCYRALIISPRDLHDLCRALHERAPSYTERRRRAAC